MVLSFLTLAGIDDDESVEAAAAFLGLVGQIQERRLIDAGYE